MLQEGGREGKGREEKREGTNKTRRPPFHLPPFRSMADAQSSPPPSFRLGQRVQSLSPEKGPQLGTVKYVGPVQGYQGLWIGVDWDDGHGRHHGSVDGVHYFDASSETSGSFVRPHSLSHGVTLLQAISSRYRSSSSDLRDDDMYVLSVRQKRVAVELVGKEKIEEKQKHLEDLRCASLVYAGVHSAGLPGEARDILPNLEELDLTGNLLPDWHAVGHICEELPALRILDLSRSRIELGRSPLPVFPHLRTLVLNSCGINWRKIEALKTSLPVLEELHLCQNGIKLLELDEDSNDASTPSRMFVQGFPLLRLLNLEQNCIENWEEIIKLCALESLEQLHVGGNRIKHIFYPKIASLVSDSAMNGFKDMNFNFKPFPSLWCLLLGSNDIQDWNSIDALNFFPNLKEVRLSDNPITDLNTGGAPRFMLVARVANITMLNGSEVKQRERRDSEIRYVHYVMNSMSTSSEEDRLRHHPRFAELKLLHDVPEASTQTRTGTGTKTMAASLLDVTLLCVAPSVGERAPSTKKLPASTTVGKLKLICESIFKVKASKQHVFLRHQDSPIPTPLNEDMETLGDIGIGLKNATILVDEINS